MVLKAFTSFSKSLPSNSFTIVLLTISFNSVKLITVPMLLLILPRVIASSENVCKC